MIKRLATAVYNRRFSLVRYHETGGHRPLGQLIVLFLLLSLTSCGKIGEPKPPYVRIPERIRDLSASQNAYDAVLSWTNPAHYIDGSTATDLSIVHITSSGRKVADVDPTGAGKPQSYSIPAKNWLGESREFSVWLETDRHKLSDVAKAQIRPVEVPGPVTNLKYVVDQYAITLTWNVPEKDESLVSGYMVQRTDRQTAVPPTTETRFTDTSFSYGKSYTYQVVAARQVDSKWIPGVALPAITVPAIDHTPPRAPTGLAIVVTDSGAIVTWNVNPELDLKGYFIYRNGRKVTEGDPQPGNSFPDPDYTENTSYSVSAVDEYGNESPRSAPIS